VSPPTVVKLLREAGFSLPVGEEYTYRGGRYVDAQFAYLNGRAADDLGRRPTRDQCRCQYRQEHWTVMAREFVVEEGIGGAGRRNWIGNYRLPFSDWYLQVEQC
jgi:hypothetical protein